MMTCSINLKVIKREVQTDTLLQKRTKKMIFLAIRLPLLQSKLKKNLKKLRLKVRKK